MVKSGIKGRQELWEVILGDRETCEIATKVNVAESFLHYSGFAGDKLILTAMEAYQRASHFFGWYNHPELPPDAS